MKKYLVILLSVALIVLSACSSGGGGSQQQSGQSQSGGGSVGSGSSSGTTTETSQEPDQEIVELSLFINHSWYPVSSWEGTVAEELTKRTGVKFNVTVASDSEQLPLMIASGDLPDLVFTVREPRLENPDLVYPWNELIEQYAPNWEIDPVRLAVNTAPDGNVYTILNAYATPEEWASAPIAIGHDGNPGIAVREDILEELGNPPINTVDDFMNVLGQVKERYPDMVPLIMDIDWIKQYFQMQMGVPPHGNWYEENGKVIHKLRHPGMLDYYKLKNEMYRKGYILAENYTFSNADIDEEYALSGRAFAHMHTVSRANANNAALERQGDSFRFKMLPSVISDRALNVDSGTGFSGVYISRTNPHPDRTIQFLEYLASDEGLELVMFGIEGEQWEWHPDGYVEFKYDPNDGDYTNEHGLKWWYLYSNAIVEGLRGYVPGSMITEALLQIREVTEFKPALGMIRVPADSNESVILNNIDEMVKNEEIKIYLANSEAEAEQAYYDMINLAEDIGLIQLEEWANGIYQQNISMFE